MRYSEIIEKAKEGRGSWENIWQDIALRVQTENAVFDTVRSPGQQRNQRVYDSTATIAVNRSAAALNGLITPQGQKWHGITTDNPYINADRSAQLFFDAVTNILFSNRYNPFGGFQQANNQIYRGTMAFGTAPMFIDEMPNGRGCRYRSLFLGKTYIMQNAWGIIDTFVREFELTKQRAIEEFGDETPTEVTIGSDNSKFTFFHVCYPNDEYEDGNQAANKRKFKYAYCLAGHLDDPFNEGGYYEFPLPVARDIPAPGEVYGRSPAMHIFPEIRMLNAIRKTTIKAAHKLVDPPLLAQSQSQFAAAGLGSRLAINMDPGGVTFGAVNAQGQQTLHPLQIGANPSVAENMIQQSREAINDAFLLNLFQVLVETPSMTATEVLARTQERGILLAPVNAQLQTDYLAVMIEREIGILSRQRLLPDLPDVLKESGGEYSIIFNSPLTRAQRSEEVNAINQITQYAAQAASYDPTVLYRINWGQNLKTMQEVLGAPANSLVSDDDYNQKIQQANQQQQQQQLIEQAPALAGAARDLSQAGMLGNQ